MVKKSVKTPAKGKNKPVLRKIPFLSVYMFSSLGVLLATTLFWAIKSASLNLYNADQIVNPFLFESAKTVQHSLIPAAHTFLIKWPAFYLIKLFSYTDGSYIISSVLAVLVTIGVLTWLIYRIERRPYVFGTICLGLASCLMLVPASPYAGALLPVNMAMLATRNLEYIIYIASLLLLFKARPIKSYRFWLAAALLGLLIASDKLFLWLSLGGAVLGLVVYSLVRRRQLAPYFAKWLGFSVIAGIISMILIRLIPLFKLGHVTSYGMGPYSFIHSLHDLSLGILYSVMGLFTDLGANPAYNAVIVRDIPSRLVHGLFSLGGLAYLINFSIFGFGVYAIYCLIKTSFRPLKTKQKKVVAPRLRNLLVYALVLTSFVAVLAYIFTGHYYAVDARYLSIWLFCVFISIAVFMSSRQWQPKLLMELGIVLVLSCILGGLAANRNFTADKQAIQPIIHRNDLVAQVLVRRHTQILVGDYWRVLPIKNLLDRPITVSPLDGCSDSRTNLTSTNWQPNLNNTSFAYLLSESGSLTNYPNCSLSQVVKAYGRPNSSTLISGSVSRPNELVLVYDHGKFKNAVPKNYMPPISPASVVPIKLAQLPAPSCDSSTVLTTVAHEDDDLLFMSPDILYDIKAGYCMRTVYLTAGDSGGGKYYWLSRQEGSEAAYAQMLGIANSWANRIIQLDSSHFINIASTQDNKVSLIFMNLPDGFFNGSGFKASDNESLAKLEAGKIKSIHTVDGQSTYSSSQLTDSLAKLIDYYKPDIIHTQSNFKGAIFPDHSDHLAVGRYTQAAYKQYKEQHLGTIINIPLRFYIGYPIHERPPNVAGSDLTDKSAAYYAYAKYDPAVCNTKAQCKNLSTIGFYLQRQYLNNY